MRAPVLVLFVWASAVFAGPAAQNLLEYDLEISGLAKTGRRQPLLLAVYNQAAGSVPELSSEFLNAVVREKLERLPISIRQSTVGVRQIFLQSPLTFNGLTLVQMVSPKLIVEVGAVAVNSRTFTVSCEINLISYRLSKNRLRPELFFTDSAHWEGLTATEIPARLAIHLRRQLERLPGALKLLPYPPQVAEGALKIVAKPRPSPSPMANPPAAPLLVAAKDREMAPGLRLGATLGTPALGNLYLEGYRPFSLPLVWSAQGMYYSTATRGLEVTTGFLPLQTGAWVHQVTLSLIWLNSSRQEIREAVDGTDLITIDELQWYGGLTYGLRWQAWSAHLGLALPINTLGSKSVRAIFHLGYSFALLNF